MTRVAGSVFVTKMDEVDAPVPAESADIVAGDAVLHHDEGPCLVLARLGDDLMLEAELAPPPEMPDPDQRPPESPPQG